MKKLLVLMVGTLMAFSAFSQTVVFTENFDGNTNSFTSSSATAWKIDTSLYVNAPNSIRGTVPNFSGNTVMLTSGTYNLSNYSYVYLRFNHICKISPRDKVQIEYKRSGMSWQLLPASTYQGEALLYQINGFNAASYVDWAVGDSTKLPEQSWWKEEMFDVGFEFGLDNEVQFRFTITHGNTSATQISYGWLIDNIEVIAAPYELKNPLVTFIEPLINDTVYSSGPYTVHAKVKTQSLYTIQTPYLVYTASANGVSNKDSVVMTAIAGDSIWTGIIPQFTVGTTVHYSITGKDAQGNAAYADSGYYIAKPSHPYGDYSIALTSIDTPLRGQTLGNVSLPVTVTIRNMGDSALTSADIYWSVNGVETQFTWSGNLAWDMSASVNLGSYTPRTDMYDTIEIWVSNPNTETDLILSDDTLQVISYGCSAALTGDYAVGSGTAYPNIAAFFDVLKNCSPAGDITLLLQTDTCKENWDFSNLSDLMGNYTLTITSAVGDADSVILAPPSGAGIKLAKTNHLVLKNITVDVTGTGRTYGINFTDSCTDITIRDCKLLASTTNTSNANNVPVYKSDVPAGTTGIADSIYFINNLVDGGYFGFYFDGGIITSYANHIVFDSNTLTNQCESGVQISYTNLASCSYNRVTSRAGNSIATTWYGLRIANSNGPIIGNRIIQSNTAITSPWGIRIDNYSINSTTDTGLIANNEIIVHASNTRYGIYLMGNSHAKVLHNSIYVTGTNAPMGIYVAASSTNELYIIKNNNIVMTALGAYPININGGSYLHHYDIDNNNMYAPQFTGRVNFVAKATMAEWQQTITTDRNSISINPAFIDPTKSLQLANYFPFYTTSVGDIPDDITGAARLGNTTSLGCYHGIVPYTANASLYDLFGNREGSIIGEEDTIKTVLFNTGSTPLTSANISWSYKGTTQSVSWTGNLTTGSLDTVILGTIQYAASGDYELVAWINNIGSLQDEFLSDDTLSRSGYICATPLSGVQKVGTAVGNDFTTIKDALNRIILCGVNGDITFELQADTFKESVNLTDISSTLGNHSLTITSADHDATKAILKTNEHGILLSNSNNIILKDITVDATEGTYAIQFANACTNVVIRECRLLADPNKSASSNVPIYKESGTGIVDSIFIINNLLDGGFYGFYFYGGTGSGNAAIYGTNVIFDSNTVSNQYSMGLYPFNIDFISCSYNTVLSRTANTGVSWNGMRLSYINGPLTNNSIIQRSTAIEYAQGIYFSYNNTYNTTKMGLIANNEIILNASDLYNYTNGIYTNTMHSRILHNSIYISGNVSTAAGIRGIYVQGSGSDLYEIKNNNIVMESTGSRPIVLNSATYIIQYDIDYNNMYAPQYVGRIGNNDAGDRTLSTWQSTVGTDKHSVSFLPSFVDSSQSLKLTDYTGLGCLPLASVRDDIEDSCRVGDSTAMGAYHGFPPLSVNASLTEILNWREGVILGQSDNISVILRNTGTTPLTTATISWSFNGGNTASIPWSGNLAYGESTVVNLGSVTYAFSENTLKAWVNISGDVYTPDDTIEVKGYVCAPLSGPYTVGATGFFSSMTEALEKLTLCGVAGDIVFEIQSGDYNQNINLANISSLLGNNSLTITSVAHKADSVVLKTNSTGVTLSNSNNIVLKDITIDAKAGTYAVQFTGACTNVLIRDCRLLADTATASTTLISMPMAANSTVDSIFIIHNLLDGGANGFHFYGGSANKYSTNFVFDSNTVSNQYQYGVYPQYIDLTSCSYNTILSRTVNTNPAWDALFLYNSNGNVIGNRIIQRTTAITSPKVTFSSYNLRSTDTGLIANNEIILAANGTSGFFGPSPSTIFTVESSHASIVHNSIFVAATGTGAGPVWGIRINDGANNYLVIKNNNIVVKSTGGIPVYIDAAYNANRYNIDYNNLYAPGRVGEIGGVNLADIPAWQQVVTTDLHSVSLSPEFIDTTVNLDLSDYSALLCPFYPGITNDIGGNRRASTTVMGAYAGFKLSMDLAIQNIICANTTPYQQPVPTSIEIINLGNNTKIDSATFGWSVNGVTQPSVKWTATSPLDIEDTETILLGDFNAEAKTNIFDIVAWIESVNGQQDSIPWNDTLKSSVKILFTGNNLRALSIEQLVPNGLLCTQDSTSLIVKVENTGTLDYDFAVNPTTFSIRVTNPEPFTFDTVISLGEIKSGETAMLTLTDMFPIVVAGIYDIEVFLNSLADAIKYDDTVREQYISGRFKLPIDEYFSQGIPIEFNRDSNTSSQWKVIAKGVGADTVVEPQFGTGMLSFVGTPGSMATLSTRQLDLSRTKEPSLSFWYFHDTIPCEDYTDVYTITNGDSIDLLLSLTKYDATFGWKQYSVDLPSHAANRCVILAFEAMEKSRSGDVVQYIDRIRITAKQDIALAEVLTSDFTACDLQNKEWKVVLSNLTDPMLHYASDSVKVVLEITGTSYVFDTLLQTGSLSSFASDTLVMASGFDLAPGTYPLKAYFSSIMDDNRLNDTLVTSLVINPKLSVSIQSESSSNPLSGELILHQTITLHNTGNMDLFDLNMIIAVDTGDNDDVYALFEEPYTGTIPAGSDVAHTFTTTYSVPWIATYTVRATVYLNCDSVLVNATNMITETVDIKDLRVISIDNPSSAKDVAGSSVQVTATLNNRSDGYIFTDIPVSVRITNSQGVQQGAIITDNVTIGTSATVSHTFSQPYTVPNDTVYYVTVFVRSQDNYLKNDTVIIKRTTDYVGIETLNGKDGFALSQNIPNPATNKTSIDYNIPEAGEVIFHLHSVSGQLLYSETIEAMRGKQSLELNTSTFASGIYFYSIEYKGQRLVKRMSIK